MMTETTDALRRVRAKIEMPEHWTQSVFARNSRGGEVHPCSPIAVCWCIQGAMMACGADGEEVYDTLDGLLYPSISAFNDACETTHSDILALLDRAIVAAEAEVME